METLLAGMKRRGLLGQMVTAVNQPEVVIAGRRVIDFAAANYLGLNCHPQIINALVAAATRWGISLGAPRRYADIWPARWLECRLAQLSSQESALLFPSTTHLALDVIPAMAGPGSAVLIDRQAYPLSWQGTRLAASGGAHVFTFPHNNLEVLESYLEKNRSAPRRLIVVDGVYPAGGELAPLAELHGLASEWNALLYIDDAHGLGVLGAGADSSQPFGYGGSGSPAYWALPQDRILHVASLSKSLGIPVAFVSGPRVLIERLRQQAGSLEHSSPSALPLLGAAHSALDVHEQEGVTRRRALLAACRSLRNVLARTGQPIIENLFLPIQSILFDSPRQAYALASKLRKRGIWGVLQFQPPDHPNGSALRFLVSAHHNPQHIACLERILQSV